MRKKERRVIPKAHSFEIGSAVLLDVDQSVVNAKRKPNEPMACDGDELTINGH